MKVNHHKLPARTQSGDWGDGELTAQLYALLGKEAFLQLCENFGGTRLCIPTKPNGKHLIVRHIGQEAAEKLAPIFSPSTIRVPLARHIRVKIYREQGLSNIAIARKFRMTETGVEKLIKRAFRGNRK